jgi:predicted nucleic acid-binding protein
MTQSVDENIHMRALELEKNGLEGIDALHLACAEAAGSQYFLTCDDRVIRRYKGNVQALNPVDFVLFTTGG